MNCIVNSPPSKTIQEKLVKSKTPFAGFYGDTMGLESQAFIVT